MAPMNLSNSYLQLEFKAGPRGARSAEAHICFSGWGEAARLTESCITYEELIVCVNRMRTDLDRIAKAGRKMFEKADQQRR